MKYLIYFTIFVITFVITLFNSYLIFIPYQAYVFLLILIIVIANNSNRIRLSIFDSFYILSFIIGATLDLMQHNVIFYNAFIFVLIMFINDYLKNIASSKFIIVLIPLIGVYNYFMYHLSFFTVILNVVMLYIFYFIIRRLLLLTHAKKD